MEIPASLAKEILADFTLQSQLRSLGSQLESKSLEVDTAANDAPKPSFGNRAAKPSARIDDDDDSSKENKFKWELHALNRKALDEKVLLSVRGRSEDSLVKAEKAIQKSVTDAQNVTHLGYLLVQDRTIFPRIVGKRGANLDKLRAESGGADINVGKENDLITIKVCVVFSVESSH